MYNDFLPVGWKHKFLVAVSVFNSNEIHIILFVGICRGDYVISTCSYKKYVGVSCHI